MTTKIRTKKPAAKPQRKPRTPRPTITPEAEAFGIHFRARASLAPKPDTVVSNANFGDVWRTAHVADKHYEKAALPHLSPIEEALQCLRSAIAAAEVTTDIERETLGVLLAPNPPTTGVMGAKQLNPVCGQLAGILNSFAERIEADNRRRINLLDLLEI